MNKLKNTDFLFSYRNDCLPNLEHNSSFIPLNISEDKSFSDLNFMDLGNNPQKYISDSNDDCSINSFDDFQSSKNLDLEYSIFNKNLNINQIEEKSDIKDINIYLNNCILFPTKKKPELKEDSINHLPLTINGFNNCNEKIAVKNENENENENDLTNQNSGIFYKIHKKKINKFRKKLKFLVLTNQKQSSSQSYNSNKNKNKKKYINNNDISNTIILKELREKNLIKIYKYKCEHPGCKKTFKTFKLKLNRHDISDCNCKKDTITLLYMINKVKKLLKKEKKKNNTRINRLKKLYKKCIYSLPHKDYAINIAGNDLIN